MSRDIRMIFVEQSEGRGRRWLLLLFPWPNNAVPLFDEVAALAILADVEFIFNNTGMEYVAVLI